MKRLFPIITVLLLAALACNLPSAQNQGNDAAFTAAAQTVVAQLTSVAQTQAAGGGITNTPAGAAVTPTATPSATSVPSTLTPTPLPCNQATFVIDVTIPDDTQVPVGASFTKIWRFKNIGTCTWTSGYQLVFDHGDQMGGPVSQPLTSGSVPPGATVDVSVNLVAPGTHGTYRGYWRFRDPSNVLFGLSTGSFWVQIKAIEPTATLPPAAIAATVDVPLVGGQSGSVRSGGSVLGVVNVGDVESNESSQAFGSFDMSGIPGGVTISAVKFSFTDFDTLGDPFGGLGCLRMYEQNYGSLDASDFTGGSPLGAFGRWCSSGELGTVAAGGSDLVSLFQSYVGSSRIKFRFQFNEHTTDSDGVADMVRLGSIKFIVSYHSP